MDQSNGTGCALHLRLKEFMHAWVARLIRQDAVPLGEQLVALSVRQHLPTCRVSATTRCHRGQAGAAAVPNRVPAKTLRRNRKLHSTTRPARCYRAAGG